MKLIAKIAPPWPGSSCKDCLLEGAWVVSGLIGVLTEVMLCPTYI